MKHEWVLINNEKKIVDVCISRYKEGDTSAEVPGGRAATIQYLLAEEARGAATAPAEMLAEC